MEREITVRKLNQQTSAVLNEVGAGVAVTVTSAGTPVARIVPVCSLPHGLEELVVEGKAIAPTMSGFIRSPKRTGRADVDVAAAMEKDRENERW